MDEWQDACDPVPKKTPMKIRTAAEMARLRRRIKNRIIGRQQVTKDSVPAFVDPDFDERF